MKLYIKYMVSFRCVRIVKSILDALGINYSEVVLGKIDLINSLKHDQYMQLRKALLLEGFELLDGKRAILIEKFKSVIMELSRGEGELPKSNFSEFISRRMNYDYTYLANLFSEVTGITIEYYVIALKVERVKEMLVSEGLNLSEISYKLNNSSVAHLSSQFKRVTGFTPSFYRQIKEHRRQVNPDYLNINL